MAYEPVTSDDLFTRFPGKFDSVDEDEVDAVLEEAHNMVDDSWLEKDYRPAILYYTAHLLTREAADEADRGVIASESFGPISRSYAVSANDGSPGADLDSTHYGRMFKILQRRNFPAVKVVG